MTVQQRFHSFLQNKNFPIVLLLTISLIIGIFTFQDYGMTWDEYLYYQYGEAIGYAYSIPAHLSPDFDLDNAYGPSAWDHQNHGPAYLIFARLGVFSLHWLTGVDKIAIWHLMNFITYLAGVYFTYKLALRWLHPYSASAAASLYLFQPVLYGHGFINPKDTPFATAFIAAVFFGLKTVDSIGRPETPKTNIWKHVLITGFFIGLATNMRITGPLTGIMILGYAFLNKNFRAAAWLVPTAIVSLLITYITWPYIWETPIATFTEVVRTMIDYPVTPKVLFLGQIYESNELPRRYLPVLLAITQTEPVWPLFFGGSIIALIRLIKKQLEWRSLTIIAFWFVFMLTYVVVSRPATYDGYRHFLFIIPPVFIIGGFVLDELYALIKQKFGYALAVILLLAPGLIANWKLHPYQYTYYNIFVGGTKNVSRTFETDYWLTCYKEIIEEFNQNAPEFAILAVRREPQNAAYYAREGITIVESKNAKSGDYILSDSRLGEQSRVFTHYPIVYSVGREGVGFCLIRLVP